MAKKLRDAVKRLADVMDRSADPSLAAAIRDAIAEAMTEELTLDLSAQDIAARISARQERELVALYGPTSFSRNHLSPQLIVQEIMASDLL